MRTALHSAIIGLALVIGAAGLSISHAAWADPPGGFKHDRDHGHHRHEDWSHGQGRGHGRSEDLRFGDRDRVAVHDYFAHLEGHGRCPPGLAMKHDGCMPPGHAKRWRIGQRLPRDVTYYNLPSALVVRLTPPPIGYRYVRVGTDILMIAAGTGMVAAAIQDLAR